ncbi:DNA replication and repair protein RecF [Desulforamulus reducens MI-1]|uniref:DNA replication and repair protein RecF n=1 Tax=Desulforamulus reducens (strain ATCC BAA-1160 / DSM 100696 / MI-1) TaxID=349161 RepID=RECF_DESRM|nr:DNA replication/repair protein RecF [Desulforamulus reducens]A4J0F3.1 RecName: Full=DNA replication and repair protein RecF [Desulforamulus reducens MI-1]ABO48556.1 DNA replication and repair protein RecF [Desulforamulus reducens MI-1]
MRVKKLSLRNFRNYKEAQFIPHPSINIITGPNAQGKTNLLEAIYYSLRGCSFRAEKDRDVTNWESNHTVINTEVNLSSRLIKLQWKIQEGSKKLSLNGVERPRSELDLFGVVLFCPEDLSLIKGSPQERRHFLDYEVGTLSPGYSQLWRQYAKILSQRNSLLKEIRDHRSKQEVLEVWDEQLYRYGAKVIYLRLQVLKKLIPIARKTHFGLTGGTEELQAKYLSSLVLEPGLSEGQIYQVFSSSSKKIRQMELKRCQTLLGPHRDDLSLAINGVEAKTFGSQGQQRTVTLSLKLSQLDLWYHEFGEYPVLLLDDVLFELDRSRQNMLIDKILNKVQTFITTSFTGGIEETIKGAGLLWQVNAGSLTQKEEF